MALLGSILLRYSVAPPISVPRPLGRNTSMSRISRSAWRRPLRGGTTCSTESVNSIVPTRSLLRIADMASTADNSDASSHLNRPRVPN